MKKIDYWQREIDEITLISHYEEVFEKILKEFEKEELDFGCWFFRFRIIPKSILESNDYSIENKKYVLKQMYLTLKEHNDSIHFNDLINEFFLLLEPYKEISDFVFKTNEKGAEENKDKKTYPEKYYALYHWLLIEMGKEKPFEKDSITDRYSKPDIIKFGKERYKFNTQGQVFYDTYINTDITKKTAIVRSYGKDYKKKLIEISNNDSDVITHLKKYPN